MKYESNRPNINAAINIGLTNALSSAGIHYQNSVKKMLNRSRGPSRPGTPPGKVTGTLGRSVQIDISGLKGKRKSVRVGTSVVYAAIHEFGGTVRAKGGALAVPIHPDAKRHSAKGGSPRSLDLQYIPRHGKPPLLIRDKGGQWDVMYVLPKSVVMPARPAWRPTFKRELKKMARIMRRQFDKAISNAGGPS